MVFWKKISIISNDYEFLSLTGMPVEILKKCAVDLVIRYGEGIQIFTN